MAGSHERPAQMRGTAYLVDTQNIADQGVFDPLASELRGVFRTPDDTKALATMIRVTMGVADEDLPKLLQYHMHQLEPLRPYVSGIRSGIVEVIRSVKRYIRETPFLEEYINAYFPLGRDSSRLFTKDGEPNADARVKREVPTFEQFARDRGRGRWLGLAEELPGLSTGIEGALPPKTELNRRGRARDSQR